MSEGDNWKTFLPAYVRLLTKNIDFISNQILAKYDLKSSYMPYIITLSHSGKATMKELSEKTGTDKSNTTRIISELRSKNIINDDRKLTSSKKYNVFLTNFGVEIATKSKKEFETSIEELFSALTPEECETLMSIMGKTMEKFKLNYRTLSDNDSNEEDSICTCVVKGLD